MWHIQNKLLVQADLTFRKAWLMAIAIKTAFYDASELNAKAADVQKKLSQNKSHPTSI